MKAPPSLASGGFALLIFLLLLIGMGGVALGGMSQKILAEVNDNKYQHNRRVLREAKQALLFYTYMYPQFAGSGEGPGRLPCPDTDNDGSPDLVASCNDTPGRFPWADPRLNFYDARDASNERLWYAVSDNFFNLGGGPNTLNSGSPGTITIYDQNGALLYDGSANGVAAVIIAPGDSINAQDRSVANRNDPAHYLDRFGTVDGEGNFVGYSNWSFVNGSSANLSDGMRLGPVRDVASNQVVINDQMIIVTAEEVTRMAEKGVLEVYRQALEDYMATPGISRFPWLYGYNNINVIDDFDSFGSPADRGNFGRIPSIFSTYFSDDDSQGIDSELIMTMGRSFRIVGQIGNPINTVNGTLATTVLSNLRFAENGSDTDDLVQIRADGQDDTDTVYLLHLYDTNNAGSWQLCGDGDNDGVLGEVLSDCNRDGAGNIDAESADNQTASKVLRIGYQIAGAAPANDLVVDLDVSDLVGDIAYVDAQAGADAYISATFQPGEANSSDIVFFYEIGDYEIDEQFDNSTWPNPHPMYGNIFASQGFGVVGANLGIVQMESVSASTIGMRFYPQLPSWAHSGRNNWHREVLMAVASSYQAGGGMDCDAVGVNDCLTIEDKKLTDQSIAALLVIAGANDITDEGAPGFADDMWKLFDPKQTDGDGVFSAGNFDNPADHDDDQFLLVRTE